MPTSEQLEQLRSLPQIEELLHHQAMQALMAVLPRELVVDMARKAVEEARTSILDAEAAAPELDELAASALRHALSLEKPSLRRVVNASGVIVHTNLGRSVLAEGAVRAVEEVARGYSTLEYDVSRMARGSRQSHYERMVCALTGAKAALAVNNNAAAVMMVLAEFAGQRDVVISRGELVEIGGSFRIPDIMALSGAHMVEVGTTNKTHLFDYERAIGDECAMLLKVHPSNFRMSGFTESVPARELRKLADRVNADRAARSGRSARDDCGARDARDASGAGMETPGELLVFEDLGSGALVSMGSGSHREKTVREALGAGPDLVSFSCDKLMGGPQAGIIAGRADLVERLKASPYARVLRLDKLAIAALEATLRLYLDEQVARTQVPTVRMLAESAEEVLARTQAIRDELAKVLTSADAQLSIEPEVSRAGGGALPMCDIATYVVRVSFARGCAPDGARHMASGRATPVFARIKDECILLDGRTVLDASEAAEIARAFAEYFEGIG